MCVCVFLPCPGWAPAQKWAGLQQQWGRKQVQQGAWPPAGEQLGVRGLVAAIEFMTSTQLSNQLHAGHDVINTEGQRG